jgi:hypothetical protein
VQGTHVTVTITKDETERYVRILTDGPRRMTKTLAEKYAAKMRGALHGARSGEVYRHYGVSHQASAPGEAPHSEAESFRLTHADTLGPGGESLGSRARRESKVSGRGTKRIPFSRRVLASPGLERLEASIRAVPVSEGAGYSEWGIVMHRKGTDLEFGTVHFAARPFIYPALQTFIGDADQWWREEMALGKGSYSAGARQLAEEAGFEIEGDFTGQEFTSEFGEL